MLINAKMRMKMRDAIAAGRLAYGRWEHEIACGEYSDGRPWGARASLAGAKLKFDYSRAAVTAMSEDLLHGWMISIPCAPGDVIAWGPNDMRLGCTLLVMLPSGYMREINRAEAKRHLKQASSGIIA